MTSLVKKIDERVEAAAGKATREMGVYVIFDNNGTGLDTRLRGMAEKEALKRVSLCIGVPPADYGVVAEADITVVIYGIAPRRTEKVTANFALRKGELNEANIEAIVKSLSEVLPK